MISNLIFFKKKFAVIGLGYVGLPLIDLLIKKNYDVIGYDISSTKVNEIKNRNKSNLEKFTNNIEDIKDRNFFIVCVPTPVDKKKKPDLKPLELASKIIGKIIKKNSFIVYESTVYPGCTEEFCIPIIEKLSKLKLNKDFYCGYSPERINPEDKKHTLENIIKVTSGSNVHATKIIDAFYKSIISAGTYTAESIKIAEAAKVIENIQRDLNIALVNELSLIFDKMNINIYDVLNAASTKWNFIKFNPGLVGGHCIGVDPYYLTYKAKKLKYNPRVILAGRKINDEMSKKLSEKIFNYFDNKRLLSKKIIILGFSFKEDSKDTRNTKIVDLYSHLKKKIKKVDIFDPIIDSNKVRKEHRINLLKKLSFNHQYDACILAVPHTKILKLINKKYRKLLKKKHLIIDLKNKLNLKKTFSN